MRFKTDFKFEDNSTRQIPTNYRQGVASFMKEGMKNENPELHYKFWGNDKANTAKPYTFCVYIPEAKHVKQKGISYLEFSHDRIGFTFSSSDPAVVINFYNSMLNLSGKYQLFKSDVILKNFHLEPEVRFNEGSARFRLMSPMIIRNMNERDDENKRGDRYVTFDDQRFIDSLYHSVSCMCREFIDEQYSLNRDDFNFVPENCKTVKVYHYDEVITAVSGTFIIEAPDDVLKLIYDIGIGARRSQGFGMVEVV